MAHLNPSVGLGCRFCGKEDNLEHLFLKCKRLECLLDCFKLLVKNSQNKGCEIKFFRKKKDVFFKLLTRNCKTAYMENQKK